MNSTDAPIRFRWLSDKGLVLSEGRRLEIDAKPGTIFSLWTGLETRDGTLIYDGDIVDSIADGRLTTDEVHWQDCAWRLGTHPGVLCDHPIFRVVTNRYASAWPRAL